MFKPGDHVECVHDVQWQNEHRRSDNAKARKRSKRAFHIEKAATYMHTDEAYVVESITPTGGLKLRGFVFAVSPNDVRLSTLKVYR